MPFGYMILLPALIPAWWIAAEWVQAWRYRNASIMDEGDLDAELAKLIANS